MDSTLWIAIVVALSSFFTTVVAPLLMAMLVNRARRHEKVEDYAREDAVAEKAKTAARELRQWQQQQADRASETARLLVNANERVAADTKTTNTKLDVIHMLVNSNMTAAMQAELDATKRELALALEVVALKGVQGKEPSVEILAAIKAAEGKINELEAQLKDRYGAAESHTNNT